jgi:hypothetical protein
MQSPVSSAAVQTESATAAVVDDLHKYAPVGAVSHTVLLLASSSRASAIER